MGRDQLENGRGAENLKGTLERLFWGATPPGFRRFASGPDRWSLLREGFESLSEFFNFVKEEHGVGSSVFVGRGRLGSLRLPAGDTALVRAYRHGGLFRHITGGHFFTWPPRPFHEIFVTVEARRRGIPTVDPLGAFVERSVGPFYRGWLITRELPGARDLWTVLQTMGVQAARKKTIVKAAAESVRLMHDHGVYHRDLNMRNILIREEGEAPRAYVIDFDKGSLFAGSVPAGKAAKNLQRLYRSIRKLDPRGKTVSGDDWKQFLQFYGGIEER